MSIKVKLIWSFIIVALLALTLSFLGLNLGMNRSMVHMYNPMISHDTMMSMYLRTTMQWSLFSSVIAFALAVGVGLWTAGRIIRPLTHLQKAAQQLDLRDLSRRVPVEGQDEIADLARTFNKMGERLEAGERSRRQLLADVAHELRHPLAILKGRLELMQEGRVTIDQEALLPLQDEVIRLTRLVGDLRDLSLAEVGALSLKRALVNPTSIVESVTTNLEPVAAAKGVELTVQLHNPLHPISADPDRLRQVLMNLLSNAVQYTPQDGKVTLTVSSEEGWLVFQVGDTGPGIAPEDLPHIFDRFYRADKARNRSAGGSGLGLAIVRSLVELHQGQVQVESGLGQGSCFTVRFPCSDKETPVKVCTECKDKNS